MGLCLCTCCRNDHTPSTYPLSNLVSVGAATPEGHRAAFSNYGARTVHLFAPGTGKTRPLLLNSEFPHRRLLSAKRVATCLQEGRVFVSEIRTTTGPSGYAVVSGTSFACPHAAGAAGLVWSAFPTLTYVEVKRALMEGCKPSAQLAGLSVCGGTLDLYRALAVAGEKPLQALNA